MVGVFFAVIFLSPMIAVVDGQTGTQTIENVTETAAPGDSINLEGTDITNGSVTVEYDDGTGYTTATEGTDYEINYEQGTLTVLESSANIDSGDELRISYEYTAATGTTAFIIGLIPLMAGVTIIGVIGLKVSEML